MADEKDPLLKRARKFTIIGGAFLMLLAVAAGGVKVVRIAWATAQKVEAYVALPEWLGRVESRVENIETNVDVVVEWVEDEKKRRKNGLGRGE